MKSLLAGLIGSALLFSAITQPPAEAQINSSRPFHYDLSEEITVSGTVTSVLARPVAGMIMGAHALLTTPSGLLDISLGNAELTGPDTVSIQAGQTMEVTGVRKTIKNQEVFLARVVKCGGHVYNIRNQHGFLTGKPGRENSQARRGGLL
jgi:hypothetical protein